MAIKFFIDQGHNPAGVNAGAEGFGLREQDITYNVGVYLAQLMRKDYRFDVKLSRNNEEESLGNTNSQSLALRVRAANNWNADYFLSIHANANTNSAVNGTEMYVYRENSPAYYLAENLMASIVDEVGTKDNRIRINKSFYVLKYTKMPAVLVELAYITNSEDSLKLRNKQKQFASALYNGILDYFGFKKI